mmetsp:Transcript_30236/g.36944  ORF Transcript_30236/g.36944 Transcript_30236/m.36944 type:complete len:128 (+) Transcript_30236:71-454(+)
MSRDVTTPNKNINKRQNRRRRYSDSEIVSLQELLIRTIEVSSASEQRHRPERRWSGGDRLLCRKRGEFRAKFDPEGNIIGDNIQQESESSAFENNTTVPKADTFNEAWKKTGFLNLNFSINFPFKRK